MAGALASSEQLSELRAHVAAARLRVARQQQVAFSLAETGHPLAPLALRVLESLRGSLDAAVIHTQRVEREAGGG